MIDLKDLRTRPDHYRRGATLKNYDPAAVDRALAADEKRVEAQKEHDAARAEQNAAGKSIGKLQGEEKQKAIESVASLKQQVKDSEERMKAADAVLQSALLEIPLPPDADVPEGKDESGNIVTRYEGEPRDFGFEPKDHITLCHELGLADFEAGVKLAGSRMYALKGAGAMLHNAVLRLAMDLMIEEGFTPAVVPVIVREETLVGTGFFPLHKEAVYHVTEDDLYLVGTGEVGLTGLHMGEVLDESQLPIRYTTVSTCFRREAGTYGKDTAGFYRVHQFDKCEQVVLCKNDEAESRAWHKKMLGYSEKLLAKLELPYRVLQCCTGDLGLKNADMVDLETFMPSRVQKGDKSTGYGETHSASRLYDFQSRRLNLRYKDADGKLQFCHTLNNTVAASPRILIPLIENHQQEDGSIVVPAALRPYMHGLDVIK